MQQPAPIVWIASYPKSGNTWLRFLVCNLLFGTQNSAADVARLIPDVHEVAEPGALSSSRLVKTHFMLSDAMPLRARTAAALYVVRHPADVLLSNYFYAQRSGGPADLGRYVDAFIASRGDPRWISLGMGSWEQNVRSWLAAPADIPVLRLRYEDLRADPVGVTAALAEQLRPGVSRQEIERVVADSSFERMRQIEEDDIRAQRIGIFYKPYLGDSIAAGRRFMREGRAGGAEAHLDEDQQRRLVATFAPLMTQLGYSPTPAV